jgi:hypothetical protein
MDIEWRTAQFFLEEDGTCEVEIDLDSHKKFRCTCLAFSKSARCKHTIWVKETMEKNEGRFQIQIPVDMDDDAAFEAMSTAEGFREFILKYGKIEVI